MIDKTYTITKVNLEEHDELLDLWEASVRATHHFLKEENLLFFKQTIHEHNYFEMVELNSIRNEGGKILGFSGTIDDSLEMLFLHPDAIGKGFGKALLNHAIETQKISKVDVNEQNTQALKFYLHHGFKVISRSELDGTGKPFPILHLELG
jgi:putative acetyltransferase